MFSSSSIEGGEMFIARKRKRIIISQKDLHSSSSEEHKKECSKIKLILSRCKGRRISKRGLLERKEVGIPRIGEGENWS